MDDEYLEEASGTLGAELEYVEGFSARYDVFPIIVALLIVLGNGTALVLVARNKKLHSVTNDVLASLAVSDFLAGFVGIPLYLVCNATYTIPWCFSSVVFWRFVSVSTVLHLTILTLHLYASVDHSARCQALLKPSISAGLICATWLSAVFVSLIQLSWMTIEDEETEAERRLVHLVYAITVLVLFLVLPLIIMIYCHLRVFTAIYRFKRKQTAGQSVKAIDPVSDDQTFEKISANWKSGIVLVGMLVVFLICWAPYFVLELVVETEGTTSLPVWAEYVLFYFTRFTASALNPVLFVIGKRDFREALCGSLGCCLTKKEDGGLQGTLHSLV